MDVQYVQHWGDDLLVCNAARVSFDKKSDWEYDLAEGADQYGNYLESVKRLSPKDEKLIHYLAKNKHTSCFEHMGATLKLKVPIFIARQIQRHRSFSYNEISRRYVDSEPEFFWPEAWRKRAENVKQGSSEEPHEDSMLWQMRMQDQANEAMSLYKYALSEGVAPELARMILPQNLYTEMYMTGNLRAWSHFLHLRLDGHAQKEVQDVAQMVADILTPLFPVSMKALLDNT